jgi:hypothetical protein
VRSWACTLLGAGLDRRVLRPVFSINAAVSRQREFLADASAVQFTRNPDGIGGALRKIGGFSPALPGVIGGALRGGRGLGSAIAHRHARTLSPLFLARRAPPSRRASLPPTRPERPIAPHLRTIGAHARGDRAARADHRGGAAAQRASGPISPLAPTAPGAPDLTASIGQAAAPADARAYAESWRDRIRTLGLDAALRDPWQARLLVLALLLDRDATMAQAQRRIVVEALSAKVTDAGHPASRRDRPAAWRAAPPARPRDAGAAATAAGRERCPAGGSPTR